MKNRLFKIVKRKDNYFYIDEKEFTEIEFRKLQKLMPETFFLIVKYEKKEVTKIK